MVCLSRSKCAAAARHRWIQMCRNFWAPLQCIPLRQKTLPISVREGVPLTGCRMLWQGKGLYSARLSLGQMCTESALSCHFQAEPSVRKNFIFTGVLEKLQQVVRGVRMWDFPISNFIVCCSLEANKAHWQWDSKCSLGLSTLECVRSTEFPLISECNLPWESFTVSESLWKHS